MNSKQNRISAFKAKQVEKDEGPKKGKKLKKSKKLKSKSEPNVIDLDTVDDLDTSTSQPDKPSSDLNLNPEPKKKSKKSKHKKRPKSYDTLENEGKSSTADAQKVDSIEISDDDSDSCVIVEESSRQVDRNLGQVEKSLGQVQGSSGQIKENSGQVERSIRRGRQLKKGSNSGEEGKACHQLQDPQYKDSNGIKKKRKSDADVDARPNSKKKSKTDLDQRSLTDLFNETANLRTFGLRMETETSGILDNQQNETELDDTDAAWNRSPTAIPVAGSVLVIASHPCIFPLKGLVRVQALVGVASIMGYHLVPGKETMNVFSPECNSLVTVATVKGKTNTKKSIQNLDSALGITDSSVLAKLRDTLKECKPYVILKFDKLETNLCSFISSFHPYTNIFKVDGDRSILNKQLMPLDVIIPRDLEVPTLSVTEQLQSVIDEWTKKVEQQCEDQPVMMVCGGKDSGKSTTNRLLINSSLNILDKVYYLECDIGQSEFTPPGVVSLVEVTSPVLGPPFTHQRKTVCSYHFGGVTPKDNPDLYMRCVQLCVKEYRHIQKPGSLIVNTMGWMKGLGWQLLLDTVRLVSPSIIVQLASNQNSQNVDPLTVGSLKDTSWTDLSQMYDGPVIERRMERVPKIIHLEVPVSTCYNFRMKSTDYRNLSILCHLGDNLEPGMTLTSVTPYTVNWKDVAIHMCHVEVPRTQVMYALNANLVALCEGDISEAERYMDDGPLFLKSKGPCKWMGYGLVRGIDMEKKMFYIITSLREEDLARVNVLDIGGVSVPENFLVAQKCERLVYVDEVVESVGLSAVRPRKHMPRKGLRGNIPR